MTSLTIKNWVHVSVFNLIVVAIFGVLMRYKIGFELPYFDQRHLQHAHSHFAFSGWVSQIIMVFMIRLLSEESGSLKLLRYSTLLWANLICSYGMLFSFSVQGYGPVSIIFSSCAVVISFLFVAMYRKSMKDIRLNQSGRNWFSASLLFNLISSFGTFALTYMMATHHIPQHAYLASVYWYLHFQYNGWFLFSSLGLLIVFLTRHLPGFRLPGAIFWLMAISCLPAYGLSVLWLGLPRLIFYPVVIASLAQFSGWIWLMIYIRKSGFFKSRTIGRVPRLLFVFVAIAATIKFGLQLGSTIPAVSELAFGFRTIVIAYLHLILLAIISMFLLAYALADKHLNDSSLTRTGLVLVAVFVFLNELILAVQGIASFSYALIPLANEALFGVAACLSLALLIVLLGSIRAGKPSYDSAHKPNCGP